MRFTPVELGCRIFSHLTLPRDARDADSYLFASSSSYIALLLFAAVEVGFLVGSQLLLPLAIIILKPLEEIGLLVLLACWDQLETRGVITFVAVRVIVIDERDVFKVAVRSCLTDGFLDEPLVLLGLVPLQNPVQLS